MVLCVTLTERHCKVMTWGNVSSAEAHSIHFSRMFKQATGMTPMQFVIRERMLHAQQLIRENIPQPHRNRVRSRLYEFEPLRSGISTNGGHGSHAISQRLKLAKRTRWAEIPVIAG
jgi:hypothetical protein